MSSPHENLRLVLPDAKADVSTQDCHPIVTESAYIRLQLNVQKQTAIAIDQSIEICLHGIDTVEAFYMAVMWSTDPVPEKFTQYLPLLEAETPESLLSRYIEYFYSLLELYHIAEKLVMKKLTLQILDLLDIDEFLESTLLDRFPGNFLRSPRAPSYAMLGYYFYCWLGIAHKEYLHLLTIEQAEPLLDTMERLREDCQVARMRVKFEHKEDIRNMEKIWQINPADDLPHRFTLFPSDAMRAGRNVIQGRKIGNEDIEMIDVF